MSVWLWYHEGYADRGRKPTRARERWGLVFHGYCLMSSHYPLEVETPEANLSRAMQWANQMYAYTVNRRH